MFYVKCDGLSAPDIILYHENNELWTVNRKKNWIYKGENKTRNVTSLRHPIPEIHTRYLRSFTHSQLTQSPIISHKNIQWKSSSVSSNEWKVECCSIAVIVMCGTKKICAVHGCKVRYRNSRLMVHIAINTQVW